MFSAARITYTFVGQTPNVRQDRSIDKLCRGKLLFEGKKLKYVFILPSMHNNMNFRWIVHKGTKYKNCVMF